VQHESLIGCREADQSRQLGAKGDVEYGIAIVDITDASQIRYGFIESTGDNQLYVAGANDFLAYDQSKSAKDLVQKFEGRSEVDDKILNVWPIKELQRPAFQRLKRYPYSDWHDPPSEDRGPWPPEKPNISPVKSCGTCGSLFWDMNSA